MEETNLLSVKDLSVSFLSNKMKSKILDNISFQLHENEILGIVGESGSGKSITALSILGLLPKSISSIDSGSIKFKEAELINLSKKSFESIRGNRISMIFQEPMSALNPSMTCGKQVSEILERHSSLSKSKIHDEVLSLFEKVKLPNAKRIYRAYPHQISGGQKQRVMIAMAIACKPDILIADEPTTALDVTVQKEIIALLKSLQKETKMSILFISHDLSLVSSIADRLVVMYQGKIVEQGSSKQIFNAPENTYTKALINSKPTSNIRYKRLPTIQDYLDEQIDRIEITKSERDKKHKNIYSKEPILEVLNVDKEYFSKVGVFQRQVGFKAVDNVSFKLYEGETLGLVGESGCGKSTLGNAILQIDKLTSGKILYRGKEITNLSTQELRHLRKDIQLIFQDPFSSLNPRIPVGKAIMEPMKVHNLYGSNKLRKEKAIEILARVGLDEDYFYRYPHEFSGGQRQRIGIARALALNPKLIICDESVSALDISVQAQVLNLLNELKETSGLTYIFISHDLSVVKYMSDQLMVMNEGKIVEKGEADSVYNNPQETYTKKLIDAIPKGI